MDGAYKQTVAPTALPVTLDEAKRQCAITGTDDHDDYIDELIRRAAETIGLYTNRQIMPATWTLTLEEFPAEIKIFKPPVSAISSIKYYDTAGTLQTLSSSYYQTDLSSYDAPARIKPAYGYCWPSTRSGIYDAVTVTFVAGYATNSAVPLPLKHAILFTVSYWFSNREPAEYGSLKEIPVGLEMLLSLEDYGVYA